MDSLKQKLRDLYNGGSEEAGLFRYGLLAFDIVTLLYFLLTATLDDRVWLHTLNLAICAVLTADFLARLWIARARGAFLIHYASLADVVVIASLALPLFLDNLAFLRAARALRIFSSYRVLSDLRSDVPFFRRNQDVIQSALNLAVFLYVTSALVYITQHATNPGINSYVDALYFTVATLTTTGFGDITLQGTGGRMLAVVIMVLGVALFLRLVQTLFQPAKVRHTCPDCGLKRHDTDAVHCKHCGRVLNIESEG